MPPIWAGIDAAQCIRAGFDESTGKFRTDATATVVAGDITVEIDGIYTVLNPEPDNIGLIGHTRSASPSALDQIIRLTAVNNASVHALDIALHLSDGSAVDSLNPLPVSITNSSFSVTQGTSPWVVSGSIAVSNFPAIQPISGNVNSSQAGLWDVSINNFPAIQSVSQSGVWTIGRTWSLSSGSDSVASIQSGTWNINNISGAVNLPTGASTSALQTSGNASLSSIDGKLNSLGQKTSTNSVPVVIASDQSAISVTGTIITSPDTNIHDSSGGNLTATGTSLNTNITNTSLSVTQGTSPWIISGAATQSGMWTTGRTWTLASGTDSIAAVQSGTWNINNISGAISLPTGASTTALQTTGNTSLSSIITNTTPLTLSQASATSGQLGNLSMGATTTAAPTYITATTNPLSLTTSGALRTDGSSSTQPISGTVSATQNGVWSIGRTWALASGTDSIASVQSGTWTIQPGNTANTTPWLSTINQGGNSAIVKAASTAAAATDPALVVAISPNNTLTVGTTDTSSTGTLGFLNATVQVNTQGQNSAGIQLAAGTLIGTLVSETSYDSGVTWNSTYFSDPSTGTLSGSLVFGSANTAAGRTIICAPGSGLIRIRVSAYTSGTANITIRASSIVPTITLSEGVPSLPGPPTIVQIGGTVTTAAPTYVNGNLNTLSLNTSGSLRTDGSSVNQPVIGAAASGATKSGNPIQIGGVFNTTQPTVTTGQIVEAQSTARGARIVATGVDAFTVKAQLQDNTGTAITLGQNVAASSIPVVIASNQSSINVTASVIPASLIKTTYSSAISALISATTATDMFTITGSGTKTIKIIEIGMSGSATAAAIGRYSLIKRSTANSAGTSTTPAVVPMDSTNAAGTAVVRAYTANPTLGTTIGIVKSIAVLIDSTTIQSNTTIIHSTDLGQPITLRGTSEVLSVNLNSTTFTGGSFNFYITWTEE